MFVVAGFICCRVTLKVEQPSFVSVIVIICHQVQNKNHLTYGNNKSWLNEWNEIYIFKLSTVLMSLARASVSLSENGFGPAYESEHGSSDEPDSKNHNICSN